MARKNRVSVSDGCYHVTARIANRAMLLEHPELKDRIIDWVISIAAFSGVEIWAFAIMDNHLHLFVHVPPVPKRYWLDPAQEPAAWAFGMRPPECTEPLWHENMMLGGCNQAESTRQGDSPRAEGSDATRHGDSPRVEAGERAVAWSYPTGPARPPLGFMLPEGELLARLAQLYSPERAEEIGTQWQELRARGNGWRVEAEKEKYCRRMYNLSQFTKTLKERIAMRYNAETGHEGVLWSGRFYSGLVEQKTVVKAVVAAYIAYNPVKAKIAASPTDWAWSSYAIAVSGESKHAAYCRAMCAKMLGMSWEDARATLAAFLNDPLPEGVTKKDLQKWYDATDGIERAAEKRSARGTGEDAAECAAVGADIEEPAAVCADVEESADEKTSGAKTFRISQVVCATLKVFRGAYIGKNRGFIAEVKKLLPQNFPRVGIKSLKRCEAFRWELPPGCPAIAHESAA